MKKRVVALILTLATLICSVGLLGATPIIKAILLHRLSALLLEKTF